MTTTDRSTAVGIFTERALAEHAIEELQNAGFIGDQIGFIAPQHQQRGAFFNNDTARPEAPIPPIALAGTTGAGGASTPGTGFGVPAAAAFLASQTSYDDLNEQGDTGAGATTGAISGGVLGGILGAVAAILIPGFGPVIAGGILAATLGGAAIGALAGGLVGALTHLGIPEEEARYYQDELNAGKTIVTVHAQGRFADAMAILRENGASNTTIRNEPGTTAPVDTNTQVADTTTPLNPDTTNTNVPTDNNAPIADTTTPADTAGQLARTGAAVNATMPNTTTGPQAAYDPVMAEQTNTANEGERSNTVSEENIN